MPGLHLQIAPVQVQLASSEPKTWLACMLHLAMCQPLAAKRTPRVLVKSADVQADAADVPKTPGMEVDFRKCAVRALALTGP